jgi:hypothetical protein
LVYHCRSYSTRRKRSNFPAESHRCPSSSYADRRQPSYGKHVADELNVDEFQAELLPEDKVNAIVALEKQGHRIAMVGDGINAMMRQRLLVQRLALRWALAELRPRLKWRILH